MAELPGKELAQELMQKSREESRRTPMEAVIEAAREGRFQQQEGFRLIGRLWTLERLFYYIYGGWGQGLEIGDCPPSVKYLFARQIMDESTHEMVYLDTLLRKRWVRTQRAAFQHPHGQFSLDSALAYYAFSLRNLATYPHPVRIAALNLGPKILELGWMEGLAEALSRVGAVEDFVVDRPSYFEILTAAAFDWFSDVAVEVAVVEAVRAALPELDRVGAQEEASPVRRARDGVGVLRRELGQPVLEPRPIGDRVGLT